MAPPGSCAWVVRGTKPKVATINTISLRMKERPSAGMASSRGFSPRVQHGASILRDGLDVDLWFYRLDDPRLDKYGPAPVRGSKRGTIAAAGARTCRPGVPGRSGAV